jgi:hypothetical protein
MAVRVKQISLMGSYLVLTTILALALWAAVISVPIIRQTEVQVGGSLTCQAAYEHQEINNYFYPARTLQADALYLFSLLSPFFLFGFAVVLVVMALYKRLKRLRWLLVSAGVLLCVVLIIYMPVIYLVACAVE